MLVLSGGTLLSRVIQQKLNSKDIFNKENETFPQEERLLENEFSINLPARYHLKNKVRNSWINIINPFRAIMVSNPTILTTNPVMLATPLFSLFFQGVFL